MLDTPHLKFAHPKGQTPPNVFRDFDWLRQHEAHLLETYGECAIVIYQGQVLGTGATLAEAILNAENNLTVDIGEITPIHTYLVKRQPFSLLISDPKK